MLDVMVSVLIMRIGWEFGSMVQDEKNSGNHDDRVAVYRQHTPSGEPLVGCEIGHTAYVGTEIATPPDHVHVVRRHKSRRCM